MTSALFVSIDMANPVGLPGGQLEICFSFDTTVSMTSYVDQVKARLLDMVQRLKSDIPGIRIALFAHGDYFQPRHGNHNPYVTRFTDFTDDVQKLCQFIEDSVPTDGNYHYTTFANFSMKYLAMCKVYTDVNGIK